MTECVSVNLPVPFDLYDRFCYKGSMSEDQGLHCNIVVYAKKYIFGLCPESLTQGS